VRLRRVALLVINIVLHRQRGQLEVDFLQVGSRTGLAAGLILFLVAWINILQQIRPPTHQEDQKSGSVFLLTMTTALTPLAFPAIVTPYESQRWSCLSLSVRIFEADCWLARSCL